MWLFSYFIEKNVSDDLRVSTDLELRRMTFSKFHQWRFFNKVFSYILGMYVTDEIADVDAGLFALK